jgi:hypothetical protein
MDLVLRGCFFKHLASVLLRTEISVFIWLESALFRLYLFFYLLSGSSFVGFEPLSREFGVKFIFGPSSSCTALVLDVGKVLFLVFWVDPKGGLLSYHY